MNISKQTFCTAILLSAVFFSALGIIDIQEKNRQLISALQSTQKMRDNLYLQWGQLLLEQSAWSTQARIQQVAIKELSMQIPQEKSIVMLEINSKTKNV